MRIYLAADYKNFAGLATFFFLLSCAQSEIWIGCSLFFLVYSLAGIWLILKQFPSRFRPYLACTGFTLVALWQLRWMIGTHYHGSYIYAVWAFLAFGIGVQYLILTMLVLNSSSKVGVTQALLLGGFWACLEMSRELLFSGFPFAPLSIVCVKAPVFLQVASYIGVYGLSGCIVICNVLLYGAIQEKSWRQFALFSSVIFSSALFGLIRIESSSLISSQKMCRLALLQTGWAPEKKIEIFEESSVLSPKEQWEQILTQIATIKDFSVDAIILPESAVSKGLNYDIGSFEDFSKLFFKIFNFSINKAERNFFTNEQVLKNLAECLQLDIVIGLDVFEPQKEKIFNSACCFSFKKSWMDRYDKQVLVPMGEYLPISALSSIAKKYGLYSFYSAGNQVGKFTLAKATILPTICYEECLSRFFKNQIKQDIDLIVNLTNDGWFLPTSFANKHLYLAQFRAVENGRWIARACNTGVTCVIDPYGRVRQKLPIKNEIGHLYQGVLLADIPAYKSTTFFNLIGEFLVRVFALMCLIEFLRRFLYRMHVTMIRENLEI